MAWYQCSCGFRKEITPRLGDTITSACHLHRSTRLDGSSAIVRMKEISTAFPADLGGLDEAALYQSVA
jgi:hypothetical protein